MFSIVGLTFQCMEIMIHLWIVLWKIAGIVLSSGAQHIKLPLNLFNLTLEIFRDTGKPTVCDEDVTCFQLAELGPGASVGRVSAGHLLFLAFQIILGLGLEAWHRPRTGDWRE
jgi:hypothetical protein